MPALIDLTNEKFGQLTVKHRDPNDPRKWYCLCDCGNIYIVFGSDLRGNRTTRCSDCRYFAIETHGASKTLEYICWYHAKERCYVSKHKSYPRYGGRGIYMCERWRTNFLNFLEDMGQKPHSGYVIDRINNDLNYTCGHCPECIEKRQPANCEWITKHESTKKRSTSITATRDDETKTLADWARKLGISPQALSNRINKRGYTLEEAISLPKGTYKNKRPGTYDRKTIKEKQDKFNIILARQQAEKEKNK